MPLPSCGDLTDRSKVYLLAEISARRLLNRVHQSINFTENVTIYTGRMLNALSSATSSPPPLPDASLLSVCSELNRQLDTWYDSLPSIVKPDLTTETAGNRQSSLLRLRYWSAKQIIYRPFMIYATSLSSEHALPQFVLERCQLCLFSCRNYLHACRESLSERTPYTYGIAQWYVTPPKRNYLKC